MSDPVELDAAGDWVFRIGCAGFGANPPTAMGLAAWLREVANYVVLNVVPDIAPVLIAMSV